MFANPAINSQLSTRNFNFQPLSLKPKIIDSLRRLESLYQNQNYQEILEEIGQYEILPIPKNDLGTLLRYKANALVALKRFEEAKITVDSGLILKEYLHLFDYSVFVYLKVCFLIKDQKTEDLLVYKRDIIDIINNANIELSYRKNLLMSYFSSLNQSASKENIYIEIINADAISHEFIEQFISDSQFSIELKTTLFAEYAKKLNIMRESKKVIEISEKYFSSLSDNPKFNEKFKLQLSEAYFQEKQYEKALEQIYECAQAHVKWKNSWKAVEILESGLNMKLPSSEKGVAIFNNGIIKKHLNRCEYEEAKKLLDPIFESPANLKHLSEAGKIMGEIARLLCSLKLQKPPKLSAVAHI